MKTVTRKMFVQLTDAQLGKLFPAYLLLDKNFCLVGSGPSIRKLLPGLQIGHAFDDCFDVISHDIATVFDIQERPDHPIEVASKCGNIRLHGLVAQQPDGYFLALRHVTTSQYLASQQLELTDFGYADPEIQAIMLIAVQRAMLEEAQDTAIELAFERQKYSALLERTSRVSGYLAHDFNNLLSIISLNTERLARTPSINRKTANLAQIIGDTAARGSEISQSLMALSHQSSETLSARSIDDIINENSAFLKTVVGSKVGVSISLHSGSHKAVVSYNGLLNCIVNLLINAREAMPHGGHISVATTVRDGLATKTDEGTESSPCKYIAIEIGDTGSGMNEALLSRAFEPLFSTKPNGTGLGLASVREYAVEMGGDVWLESTPGEGTRVFLHFPIAADAMTCTDDQSAEDQSFDAVQNERSILLVEDEPYALEALVEMLEMEGYFVTPCLSAAQALEALEKRSYRLLLTDIVMPQQNGAELANKACIAQPGIRVIIMSGFVPKTAALQSGWMFIRKMSGFVPETAALQSGWMLIRKPLVSSELLGLVDKLM